MFFTEIITLSMVSLEIKVKIQKKTSFLQPSKDGPRSGDAKIGDALVFAKKTEVLLFSSWFFQKFSVSFCLSSFFAACLVSGLLASFGSLWFCCLPRAFL